MNARYLRALWGFTVLLLVFEMNPGLVMMALIVVSLALTVVID